MLIRIKKTTKKLVKPSKKPIKNKKAAAGKLIATKKVEITDIVVDYKSACKVLKRKPLLPDLSMLPNKHKKHVIADIILTAIIEAWNEGWKPNFLDTNQNKHFVWCWLEEDNEHPSGIGFFKITYNCTITHSAVGSRYMLKTSSLALLLGNKFPDLFKDYFFIPN